ncbi:MAG TPA: hypothetical protein VGQ36_10075 [Thermoanaerobaculia bacterium]|nr:hypothetical protein [Thermoanaerobaculia bacterium]
MKKFAAIAVLVLGSVACGDRDKPVDPATTSNEPAVSATVESSTEASPSATTTETSATTVTETPAPTATDTNGTPNP